ncbi:MAG: hypothetical protein PHV53_03880 [Fermentimonas sp.]|nr:hypothetical protein [Fermentimonas sp.]
MKNKISLLFLISALLILSVTGCTGNKSNVTDIGDLIINAESMIDEHVIVEGLCTHVCEKSGMKLFLKDEASGQTVRAESSATLGKFDPDCVDNFVRVRGTIVKDVKLTDSTHLHETEVCEGEESQILFHIAAEHYQIIDKEKL